RMGRLLHERVKVPRCHRLLDWAIEIMNRTAEKKSILEVEFRHEEGTGLGPTLEFYALVALELQRKDLCMWLCNDILIDTISDASSTLSSTADRKSNPDYYVHYPAGLFPAPLPSHHPTAAKAARMFHFLG